MKPLKFHPQAASELEASVIFYNERVPGLGSQFFSLVTACAAQIQKDPKRSALRQDGTRKRVLHRFPYHLVYRDEPGHVLIVAVAHGARRPGYWRQRL